MSRVSRAARREGKMRPLTGKLSRLEWAENTPSVTKGKSKMSRKMSRSEECDAPGDGNATA
jgi:hypothetical protein